MTFEISDEKTSPNDHIEHLLTPRMLCAILSPFTSCLPSKSTPPVLYQRLPSPDSIRLLQIHSGNLGADLNCGLKLALLDSTLLSYEALSYVWGSTEGQKEIWLNGFKKKVNKNLYEALRRLRKKHAKRTIWVDALCINQDDCHEKGHQVGLMSHIYARAAKVLVWLGTDDYEEAERAFELLRVVVHTHDKDKKKGKIWGLSIPQLSTKSNKKKIDAPPPLGSNLWIPVLALFTNIWFLRMWVLQEIVLAKTATFIWGPFWLDWKIIESAISIIKSDSALYAKLESRELQNAVFMSHLRKVRLNAMKSTHPFLHLLDLARSFDVTEAEDKVYGLLGFPISLPSSSSSSSSEIFIEPDYSSSIASIYTSVALKLIFQSGNLDVLSFAAHTADEEDEKERNEKERPQKGRYEKQAGEQKDIPSWVPNWNAKTIVFPIAGLEIENRYSTGTHRPLYILPTSATGTLSVKGLQLDTVLEVCAPVPFESIDELDSQVKRLVEWCTERKTNPTQPVSSPSTSQLFTVVSLASILTAGRQSNGALITDPSQHGLDFFVYLSNALFSLNKKEHIRRKEARTKVEISFQDDSKSQYNVQLRRDKEADERLDNNTEVEVREQNEPAISISNSALINCFPREANHTLKEDGCNPDAAREAIFKATCYRSLFTTSSGRLGLGPGAMKEGDVIVALWGAQVPFILRKEEGGWYRFVGECYVCEYMDRGAVEKVFEESGVEEVFELR
jgi:hypothetical protein